mmetsp:Transcript_96554/g.133882  ORF Transcript_96554/g.133882 Transcript_96554/m.133882 type:complete len:242 (-) Transcript_96554:166-891(-)
MVPYLPIGWLPSHPLTRILPRQAWEMGRRLQPLRPMRRGTSSKSAWLVASNPMKTKRQRNCPAFPARRRGASSTSAAWGGGGNGGTGLSSPGGNVGASNGGGTGQDGVEKVGENGAGLTSGVVLKQVNRPARASEAAQAARAGRLELTQCSRVASVLTSGLLDPVFVFTCIGDDDDGAAVSFQHVGIGTFMGSRSRQGVRGESEIEVAELLHIGVTSSCETTTSSVVVLGVDSMSSSLITS